MSRHVQAEGNAGRCVCTSGIAANAECDTVPDGVTSLRAAVRLGRNKARYPIVAISILRDHFHLRAIRCALSENRRFSEPSPRHQGASLRRAWPSTPVTGITARSRPAVPVCGCHQPQH